MRSHEEFGYLGGAPGLSRVEATWGYMGLNAQEDCTDYGVWQVLVLPLTATATLALVGACGSPACCLQAPISHSPQGILADTHAAAQV
jgi:hypothetical protein